jgi:hypothetical protein
MRQVVGHPRLPRRRGGRLADHRIRLAGGIVGGEEDEQGADHPEAVDGCTRHVGQPQLEHAGDDRRDAAREVAGREPSVSDRDGESRACHRPGPHPPRRSLVRCRRVRHLLALAPARVNFDETSTWQD